MYYPEASHAFATSADWQTAHAAHCSHSADFFFTSRSRPLRHRPRTSSPPGSALAAQARCTSSNDSLLPNSSSLNPGLQAHMTHPDPLLYPATLAYLFPRLADVCPGLEKRLLCRFNHRYRLALYAWLMLAFLFPTPQRSVPSPTIPALQAVEKPIDRNILPRPRQRLPSHGSIRTAPPQLFNLNSHSISAEQFR